MNLETTSLEDLLRLGNETTDMNELKDILQEILKREGSLQIQLADLLEKYYKNI